MATLTFQRAKITGTTVTMAAATALGDKVAANPKGVLKVTNGDASAKTVTIVVPGNTKFGQADPDIAVVVAAGATAYIGPLAQDLSDPTDDLVHITYSAVTSVTVAAVSL
jgi:hypothetical protein